jgi:hypothetical protein
MIFDGTMTGNNEADTERLESVSLFGDFFDAVFDGTMTGNVSLFGECFDDVFDGIKLRRPDLATPSDDERVAII